MITVVTVYYEPYDGVPQFSRCYTPEWVDKLYRGVARFYHHPFRFVCLTDRDDYQFQESIEIQQLKDRAWNRACMEGLGVKADRIVFMGLDTIITGDLDHIFEYNGLLTVPRDVYRKNHATNSVVLCPPRPDLVDVSGVTDMTVLDSVPHDWLDDLFPGQIVSYKAHVRINGVGDARIVYFHGEPKPHQLMEPWIKEYWR